MDRAPAPRFRFGRSERPLRPGETVLAALSRGRWPSLARSVRYHRPRGPFCGVGDCTGCLVRVNGVPNVRACRRPVAEGDVVRSENSWPSPRFDLFGALDVLLPHGVDTVHGLRWPAWAAPLYQRVGRRLAGFGRAPDRTAGMRLGSSGSRDADVVVVGAGSAGRAVVAALARRGVRPVVLERRRDGGAGTDGTAPWTGAEVLRGVTASVMPPPGPEDGRRLVLTGFDEGGGGIVVRGRTVVLATGGYDAGLLFEGSDRPGVVTADLALSGLDVPFEDAVVVGGGARAREVVEHLERNVRAVIAWGDISSELARSAVDRDIPLYPHSRVVRAVGRGHVRAVQLARRDGGGVFRLTCRTIVLAHRRLPNAQLAFQVGAARRWYDVPGAYYPEVDAVGRTVVPGVFTVGSAALPPGRAGPSAEEVAAAILEPPGPPTPSAVPPGPPGEVVPYYRELLREPRRGKWVLCPCEDVLLEELERAVARGYRGLEVGMRYTGVGTGLCQGRYCLPEAIAVLAVLEGRPPSEVGHVTQRPPLVPTPLGALAAVSGELDTEPAP